MNLHPHSFRLKIHQQQQSCEFELSGGNGQQILSCLPTAAPVIQRYQEWQRAYLGFYQAMSLTDLPITPDFFPSADPSLRGRTGSSGRITPSSADRQTQLVQAETSLLLEFHRWLRDGELFEIRQAIAQASRQLQNSAQPNHSAPILQLFITCSSLELARLPWESWEISSEFATIGKVKILRTPLNIHIGTASQPMPLRQGKARILAILGDATGLNFQDDKAAVRSLSPLAEIQFIGWQPGQTAEQAKTQIQQALVDKAGWDILFFAGHSSETHLTGGELAIAPGVSISLIEITSQLIKAREQGLQFALFNSCNGLNLAETLVSLGFSQVAVMREPIHNRVTQEFLSRFMNQLARHCDVHEALWSTCHQLKVDTNLTYPSAHLIPSLFCHPGATPFRLQKQGWQQMLQGFKPKRWEAVALTLCLAAGVIPGIQEYFLSGRTGVQAVYRDVTQQIPPLKIPPVVLVQVDAESIKRDRRIAKPHPINRSYLADLVDQLVDRNASVIGIDYTSDRADTVLENDQIFTSTIQKAVQDHQVWTVFGIFFADENHSSSASSSTASPSIASPGIVNPNWSLEGYIEASSWYATIPITGEDCRQSCPFSYLLALTQSARQEYSGQLPQPQLQSQTRLRNQLLDFIEKQSSDSSLSAYPRSPDQTKAIAQSRLHPISTLSYSLLNQSWLMPVLDFSIPPNHVYDRVAAWRLLNETPPALPQISQQIVIIGAGGYPESGLVAGGIPDYSPLPLATRYWQLRLPASNTAAAFPDGQTENNPAFLPVLTGAEIHAYSIHHILNRHWIIPVPDVWMVGIGIVIGKGTERWIIGQKRKRKWTQKGNRLALYSYLSGTALYGVMGLQAYVSLAILLPWLLPSVMFWVYVLPELRKK